MMIHTVNKELFSTQTLNKETEEGAEEETEVVVEETEEGDVVEVALKRETKRRMATLKSNASTAIRKVTLLLFVLTRKKNKSSTKQKHKMHM